MTMNITNADDINNDIVRMGNDIPEIAKQLDVIYRLCRQHKVVYHEIMGSKSADTDMAYIVTVDKVGNITIDKL